MIGATGMRRFILALCLAVVCVGLRAAEPEAQEVRLGVLSFRSLEHTAAQWGPLADYLSQRVSGYRFRIVPLFYPELDRAVARHELDLVLTNPEHYVLLRSRHGLAAQATLMAMAGDYPTSQFGGVIAVRADRDDIATLRDLKGKRVASPGEQSLGGYLMQRWALLQEGVDITSDLRFLHFTGLPHDKAVLEVLANQADAGFVRTGVLEAMLAEGRIKPGQLRVLKQPSTPDFPQMLSTDLYPEWPLSAASGVPGWFTKQVVQALFALDATSEAARAGGFFGFAPAGDYSRVETLMAKLRVHPDHQLSLKQLIERYPQWLLAGLLVLLVAAIALVVMRRINRRLRAALAEAERLGMRDTLLESLGEGVVGIDPRGRIMFINATALAGLGLSREEALGRDLHGITHPHGDGRDDSGEGGLLPSGPQDASPPSGADWYERKNGERSPVRLNARPIVDARARAMLGGLSGRLATRMGAAIRHSTRQLLRSPAQRRLLLILSDGRPADYDDGGDPRYLQEDTRMAVREARDLGVHAFCISLDPRGGDYLPLVFGQGHYLVLPQIDHLPQRLPEIYLRLRGHG